MDEERMKVLQMLGEHRITADQAERLLDSLGRAGGEPMSARAEQAIGKLGEIIGRVFTGRHAWDREARQVEGEPVPEPGQGFALGSGDSLAVLATAGNVRIVQRDDAEVATVSSPAGRPADVRRKGTTCIVRASIPPGDLDITIPPIKSLDVKLSGGSARLEGVGADVRISVRGGNLAADGCTGRFDVKCMGGSADIRGRISGIDVKCMGGSIALNALHLVEGEHRVRAAGGEVDLTVSPGSSLTVRASVLGGSVTSDLPVEREDRRGPRARAEYRIGDGRAFLDVKAMGGNVHIGLAQQAGATSPAGGPEEE